MFSAKDLIASKNPSTQYKIDKSLRFRASASAYLNRTSVASPTNVKKYTVSFWTKLSKLGDTVFMNTGSTGATGSWIYIDSNNKINFNDYCSGSRCQKVTTPLYRDPSSWYHIVCTLDTTVPAMKVYVNGVEVTVFGTNTAPTLNANSSLNAASAVVNIGRDTGSASYFDGYLAEFNYLDGYAYDPTYFGAFDATTGIWTPKAYSAGNYGTNGFYLKFTDVGATSGSNSGYGKDFSGNSNYWTTNNFGTTSTAVTYDSMIDTPTPYSDNGNNVGNYCTFNPLVNSSTTTISGGNLNYTASTGYDATGTQAPNYKCYFEMTVISVGASTPAVAMGDVSVYNPWVNNWSGVTGAFGVRPSGLVIVNGVNGSTYSTYTTNDVVGFAFDPATGKFWYHVNGTWANSGNPDAGTGNVGTGTIGLNYVPVAYVGTSNGVNANFGQRPFAYALNSTNKTSTFKAINTYNLTAPTISAGANYMAAVTYQGATAPNTVTTTSSNSGNNPNGITFQPDLVWIKSRSAATDNKLTDAVRGTTKALISNTTGGETTDTNGLTAFTASGFTVGSDTTYNNTTGPATYVAWQWKAGNGTVSNTSGSITSTVSANTSAGFSIVTYTGTGANATVGHGLGVAPSMIIGKKRSAAGSWQTYLSSISGMAGGYIVLNGTGAFVGSTPSIWNNTAPTSTVFSLGTDTDLNANGATNVAYCWAAVSGYSSFGAYTGTGSADGVYVYTNMRPRWLLVKRTDAAGYYWWMWDTSRNTYNAADAILNPNVSDAEASGSTYAFDILSNGFKVRTTSASFNASGGTYSYAAFAENPFKYALAR